MRLWLLSTLLFLLLRELTEFGKKTEKKKKGVCCHNLQVLHREVCHTLSLKNVDPTEGFQRLKTEVRMHLLSVIFHCVKWCRVYDLHLLVVADSVSQHGDLLEHIGGREG